MVSLWTTVTLIQVNRVTGKKKSSIFSLDDHAAYLLSFLHVYLRLREYYKKPVQAVLVTNNVSSNYIL